MIMSIDRKVNAELILGPVCRESEGSKMEVKRKKSDSKRDGAERVIRNLCACSNKRKIKLADE